MATYKISVSPAKMNDTAGKISTAANEYGSIVNSLYAEIDEMGQFWKNKDNVAYVNQIRGFKDDFDDLQKKMNDYSIFMSKAAKNYQDTQDNLTDSAKSTLKVNR